MIIYLIDCETEINTWRHYILFSTISALEDVSHFTGATMEVITEMAGTPDSTVYSHVVMYKEKKSSSKR